MEPSEAPSLMLQAEKALQQPVRPHLISYCPTMDLVAVVTHGENLDVYRLNGQRAFGLKRKTVDSTVDSICWKFNGQHIAVAWDDGSVDIVSSETGKTVKQVHRDLTPPDADDSPAPRISCLGWGVNFIDVAAVKARTGAKDGTLLSDGSGRNNPFGTTDNWNTRHDEVTLDDFLERQPDLQKLGISPDLPDHIALIDVQDVLPKLPVIPAPPTMGIPTMSKASSSDAFSSQQSIDAIFHSQHLRDHNAVDVLLMGCDDGTVSPTIYDSLEIGSMRAPSQWSLPSQYPLVHASHPYSCSHMSLMTIKGGTEQGCRLALMPLTLRFIPTTGIYLHLIASKTAQLQNLLQYLQSCLRTIVTYFHHARDLPLRFMRNINETLAEKGEGNLIENLYHVAATGHCPATIKEWLVDELTESGHKRWDHAASQGYTKVLELTHENFLPALDRCSIVVSMLRGLALYTGSSSIINVPAEELTVILETIRCLRLLGHNILIYAGEERRQFTVFSKWLRHEIDTQASDPSSQSAEEAADRDPGIDYTKLLAYITGAMSQSKLAPFLRRQADIINPEVELLEYEHVKRSMQQHKQGQPILEGSLCTWSVGEMLQAQCRTLFAQITAWQAANSSMGCGLVLEEGQVSEARDMRMVYEKPKMSSDISTYVALVPSHATSEVRLHRIIHADRLDHIENAVRSMQAVTVQFGTAEIKDVKFADDTSIIVLLRHDGTSYLLSLPYSTHSHDTTPTVLHKQSKVTAPPSLLPHCLPNGSAPASRTREFWAPEPAEWQRFVKHVFPPTERFTPIKIDVNGRKDRRVVCALGDDLKHYKIYDLDYESGREGEGDTTVDTAMSG